MAGSMYALTLSHRQRACRMRSKYIALPLVLLQSIEVFRHIAPAYVGLCGSDVTEYMAGPISIPGSATKPHPITQQSVPITLGHEFSGTVIAVGSAAAETHPGLKLGARVAVQPTLSCGTCPSCVADAEHVCHSGGFVGISGGAGGLADECCVEPRRCFELPDHISLREGALVEPLAVAAHAVDLAGFFDKTQRNSSALVVGAGPIGLAITHLLHVAGVNTIIVTEPAAARRQLAAQIGATHVLDPTDPTQEVVAQVARLCPESGGVDTAFDCAGVTGSIRTAMLAVRGKGTVVNIALWKGEVNFSPNLLLRREITYVGSTAMQAKDFERIIELMKDQKIMADTLVTAVMGMDQVDKGLLELQKGDQVKILVKVNGG